MRFSSYDVALREFTIAPPAGLRVLRPAETGVDILSGIEQHRENMTSTGSSAGPDEAAP